MDELSVNQRRFRAAASAAMFVAFAVAAAVGHPLFPEVPPPAFLVACAAGGAWSVWLLVRKPQPYDAAKAEARDEAIGRAIEIVSVVCSVVVLLVLASLLVLWWLT
jgi:hypothetical protein